MSNLGMFGIERFTAIINPPEAAILAVGGVSDEPVVKGGAVVAGKRMTLTLSATTGSSTAPRDAAERVRTGGATVDR
jgi:pyruvate/2-oxoglutarate dehydrogenase complex dihydrolipoamide acyltransferase (E2) component